jgi:two-component sensor histidine kinase
MVRRYEATSSSDSSSINTILYSVFSLRKTLGRLNAFFNIVGAIYCFATAERHLKISEIHHLVKLHISNISSILFHLFLSIFENIVILNCAVTASVPGDKIFFTLSSYI